MTARGIVFSGSRASEPRVVALSNPTKLKSARTRPRRRPLPVMLRNWICGQSRCQPFRKRTSTTTIRMKETETASIQSMRRAEILTSRHAMPMEMGVTRTARKGGGRQWPGGSRAGGGGGAQEEVCVVIEASDYAGARGDVGEEQAPGCGGAERRRKNHGGVGVERSGRSGVAREFSYAEGDEQNGDGCENVGEPGAVAG